MLPGRSKWPKLSLVSLAGLSSISRILIRFPCHWVAGHFIEYMALYRFLIWIDVIRCQSILPIVFGSLGAVNRKKRRVGQLAVDRNENNQRAPSIELPYVASPVCGRAFLTLAGKSSMHSNNRSAPSFDNASWSSGISTLSGTIAWR